jgi:prepilin signal peptidase PulO-like enzyme (type II secretory pathway)
MLDLAELILIIICGLCAGSFVTMASYRFAIQSQDLSNLILSRSSCVNCGAKLKIKNLIPLISWLFQKGKCSFCKTAISIRYPLIEFSTMIIFLLVYFSQGKILSAQMVVIFLMVTLLMIMIVTDLENYFIPDITQILMIYLIIIYHLVTGYEQLPYYFFSAFLYALFGFALHYGFIYIAKKEALGIDDIKFFAVAGLLLGLKQFPIFMLLSGAAGIVFGLVWKKITADEIFPFAPALVFSLIICLLYKDYLIL